MKVEFTQFHLPDGRTSQEFIELEHEGLEAKLKEINEAGCILTAEILPNGICSFCVSHQDGDFDMELCPNGSQVPNAIIQMIMRFNREQFDAWLDEMILDAQDP